MPEECSHEETHVDLNLSLTIRLKPDSCTSIVPQEFCEWNILFEHFKMQQNQWISRTQLRQTQARDLGQPTIFSLVAVCWFIMSYFLTVWKRMNKTGLKERLYTNAEQEQTHSVCTEYAISLHVTTFIHSNQMRNSMLLRTQNTTAFLQLNSFIIWFIRTKTKLQIWSI